MIKTFADKETERIWNGFQSRRLPTEIKDIARRKLRVINNAQNMNDLRIPPSYHLEKLSGDLINYNSIRINNQWRFIFIWKDDNAYELKIIDYH